VTFRALPASAAWRHRDAREGFETVFFASDRRGYRLEGHTAAVEGGRSWAVRFLIALDEHWVTRSATVWGRSTDGERVVSLACDGSTRWQVDGSERPELDGCLDVDLESSACTNTIPVHRMRLGIGEFRQAPAVYVRALDLGVERLEQSYLRSDDEGPRQCYDYRSPGFDFRCRLVVDEAGLVVDYPGIATRVA
jgi:hypothetical protein